jgi:hypothetical protein
MAPEAVIALLALVFSLVAFIRGEFMQRALRRSQSEDASVLANIASLVEVWRNIGAKPSLLRFHGVTEDELKSCGVDAEELAYLIISFEAASHYYKYIDNRVIPFPRESIRFRMCSSEHTRRAWPVVKKFLPADTPYFERIEATMAQCERMAARQSPPNPAAPADQKAPLSGR